ncbi:unnamed protein product [Moneuplotes crassus]|uniref:Uncharacterized protein n=1 Tax=Euplotes crassus TaxID=5936 RepID=A0AAD1UI62_EUPCR|nr:unnamed protein product [Moneuplotes crassus]
MIDQDEVPIFIDNLSQTDSSFDEFGKDSVSKKLSNGSPLSGRLPCRNSYAQSLGREIVLDEENEDLEETKELKTLRKKCKCGRPKREPLVKDLEKRPLNLKSQRSLQRFDILKHNPKNFKERSYIFDLKTSPPKIQKIPITNKFYKRSDFKYSSNYSTEPSTSRVTRNIQRHTKYHNYIKQRSISRTSSNSFLNPQNSIQKQFQKSSVPNLTRARVNSYSLQDLHIPHKLRLPKTKIPKELLLSSRFSRRA